MKVGSKVKQAQTKLPADITIMSSAIPTLTRIFRRKYSLQYLFPWAFSKVQFLAGVVLTFQSTSELVVFAP